MLSPQDKGPIFNDMKGSGTGPLDYESRDPVPDTEAETLPFKYFFDQLSFYLKQKTEKYGSLVVSAHTGLRC